ncbi:MAG: hypothetical protein KF878_31240 [Planctomycetes bacterium]|nr:hypothetical protein [Planctomycetota bacterium]
MLRPPCAGPPAATAAPPRRVPTLLLPCFFAPLALRPVVAARGALGLGTVVAARGRALGLRAVVAAREPRSACGRSSRRGA